ncbi:DUF1799 domain-containing protein [Achromobacter sp. SLBN-14]|uniref:DUF1799 domain-containing protein n=1 Tax=Achromobacter sp. SLBN-14 TaxID=2768442 RepID=UPI0011535F16|nr:DUF1799 domain-containing protein [Achromobacter sp. SLBN-14]TQJ97325.1 uncharacterized protein DUF1799 [Achromobacter sp. SLBN-14]
MAAFLWEPPSAATLAKAGLRLTDFPRPRAELWPEHVPAFNLFTRNYTQWRVGAGGPIGLDYGVLYHDLDRQELPRAEQQEIMDVLRIIERAALEIFHKS